MGVCVGHVCGVAVVLIALEPAVLYSHGTGVDPAAPPPACDILFIRRRDARRLHNEDELYAWFRRHYPGAVVSAVMFDAIPPRGQVHSCVCVGAVDEGT